MTYFFNSRADCFFHNNSISHSYGKNLDKQELSMLQFHHKISITIIIKRLMEEKAADYDRKR